MSIADNLQMLRQQIHACEKAHARPANSVSLLAASKGQSLEKMLAAYAAGQTIFGENYLQEALSKMAILTSDTIEWHFIGPVQSNKTRAIAENFHWVHTIDDFKIAKRLNDQRPPHLPPLNICIEVNINEEENKAGVKPYEVAELANFCQSLPALALRGLMAIPMLNDDSNVQRNNFQQLRNIYQHLCMQGFALDTLSMGMSQDFAVAIAEGATIVRIGTALFGPRE